MIRRSLGLAVTLGALVAGCGESDSKSTHSSTGGAGDGAGGGGIAGQTFGGMSGARASGGSAGASGASGGTSGAAAGMSGAAGTAGGGSNDPCPAEQVDCNGTCVGIGASGGGCTVLSAAGINVQIALGMALDEEYVYWSEEGARIAVARTPKSGGPREELVTCDDIPFELSVTSTSVFWSEGGFSTNRLRMVPKAGGTALDLLAQADEIHPVVASDTRVYFVTGPFGETRNVKSVDFMGEDEITHGQSDGLVDPKELVVTESALYWTSTGSDIRTASVTGTEQTPFARVAGIASMIRMGDALYVIAGTGTQSIQRIDLDDGSVTTVYSGAEIGGQLAASGSTLYFATATSLKSLAMGESTAQQILTTRSSIGYMVADASGVYVALNRGDNMGLGVIAKVQ